MDDETRNAIYAGNFKVFAEVSPRRVDQLIRPLEGWVNDLAKCKKELEKIIPAGTGQLVPIVMSSTPVTITVAEVEVTGKQAGLFSQGDTLDTRIHDDASERLSLAEDISKQSIDVGHSIVEELERRPVSAEELEFMISVSPDERITRNVIQMARSERIDIDFHDGGRQLGGFRNVPSEVVSEKIITVMGCRVTSDLKGGVLQLYIKEPEDLLHAGWCKRNEVRVISDEDSFHGQIARLARVLKVEFDCHIGLSEKMVNGKRSMVLLDILDHEPILRDATRYLQALAEAAPRTADEGTIP